ncbi:MAG TPA: MgtC/SapB family protein [Vicinamibacterales bacterium]|jgi:putative Mg2+ transporter-C (MgtC) family protein|nr:MgtC/SapB family protein [Vicinamibacterales bacterium]
MTALTDTELIQRLLLAAVIGGLIGAERELRRKSAGFRTNILIGVGAAIFTLAGMGMGPSSDPARVAAQVVTGIGFLGAGAILRNRDGVHGLTTAATVWVNAALGVAAGGGQFHLAIVGGAIVIAVLLVLGPIEAAIELKSGPKRTP